MSKKIFVGNLSPKIKDKQIFDLFSKYGQVTSVKITTTLESNPNNGYGYVIMSNDNETQNAIRKLNHFMLDNRNLKVIEAHPIDQEGHRFAYTRYNPKRRSQRK